MKAIIVYGPDGEILAAVCGTDCPDEVYCMTKELPDDAVLDSVDITDPQLPEVIYHIADPEEAEEAQEESIPMESEEEIAVRQRMELIEEIRSRVSAGENRQEIINAMDLTNTEKWQLDKEVKEG